MFMFLAFLARSHIHLEKLERPIILTVSILKVRNSTDEQNSVTNLKSPRNSPPKLIDVRIPKFARENAQGNNARMLVAILYILRRI